MIYLARMLPGKFSSFCDLRLHPDGKFHLLHNQMICLVERNTAVIISNLWTLVLYPEH
jgi:hypothetical protein